MCLLHTEITYVEKKVCRACGVAIQEYLHDLSDVRGLG